MKIFTESTLADAAQAYLVSCRASTQVKVFTASASLGLDQVVLGCVRDLELEARRVSEGYIEETELEALRCTLNCLSGEKLSLPLGREEFPIDEHVS